MNFAELEQAHLARLRQLQARYDCAANVNNEDGMTNIQNLIDQENERWSQTSVSLDPTTKTTK